MSANHRLTYHAEREPTEKGGTMAGTARSGGKNKTPVEAKARRGTASKTELAIVAGTIAAQSAGAPDPLRPLVKGGAGEKLWQSLWASSAVWLRPDTDLDLVQMLCELTEEYVALRQQVIIDGDYHDRSALRALEKSRFSLVCSLGLTPVDRARLGLQAVKVESQMQQFRNSVAKKRANEA
jgi:hypothetical protein